MGDINMTNFYLPSCDDERLKYAGDYLEYLGYKRVDTFDKTDFTLLGVNPRDRDLYSSKPVYAGNICANNVFDYTKDECFALENAFLTAEGAISLAVASSSSTMINSKILITGFGRISKALLHLLAPFTKDITICARNQFQLNTAKMLGAKAITFNELDYLNKYDFIFNTVPHPIFNKNELSNISKEALLIDLASFPGGVDTHFAKAFNINLVVARGLPAKYSPKTAGEIVAKAVHNMIKREEII